MIFTSLPGFKYAEFDNLEVQRLLLVQIRPVFWLNLFKVKEALDQLL